MSGPIVEMLVVQSWNSHNILSFDQLCSTVSGDSSSVIKHKITWLCQTNSSLWVSSMSRSV